ncbi:hypothetical protein NQ314_005575 [Rhamnusium bicolor]|uniref:Uncharacterized protein n=1 Tax=Rhamnusium bicolor TaxID=1586634 RepID=A0AAV8ZGS8_9CUCU|nr:hypothetical protein NQ314_005575 [Rhamnusium bicolor]
MSVKAKISKAKRNNQKRNKLVKQGLIKKSKNPSKQIKELPAPHKIQNKEVEDDSKKVTMGKICCKW